MSSGIGKGMLGRLIKDGFHVMGTVMCKQDIEDLLAEFPERFMPLLLDVTRPESISESVKTVAHHVGAQGLYALINNAGIVKNGPIEYLEIQDFRNVFEVNFFGLLAVTKAFLPLLKQSGQTSKIINISSIYGNIAPPYVSPYASSKFAVEALSDSLRRELKYENIQVVVVKPGFVKTKLTVNGNPGNEKNMFPVSHKQPMASLDLISGWLTNTGMSVDHIAVKISKLLAKKSKTPILNIGKTDNGMVSLPVPANQAC